MGRTPADIVVTNINLVSSTTGEILEDASIIIKGRRIARIGEIADVSKYISSRTIVIDGRKRYAVPGFIDLHIHIESTLLDPIGFSKIALKHGTTTVVADPHEIVNVLGLKGLEIFTKVSRELPLKILYEVPSCVPATDPSYMLETPGNIMSSREVKEALNMDGIIGLGEVMDFISVVNANREVLSKIQAASERRMVIDGHAPLLSDEKLDAYIAAGILSDHESTGSREALEKLRRGMYIFIREGSAWRDLKALLPLIR
ncbi:MAG: amidohydrolase family protein, partial [Desulfurococcus sp.]|uniref:amidohydrolase family protein n=1 Tax=Desulfurococcus sp. TaxID=51678 RepID=UPI003D09AA7A